MKQNQAQKSLQGHRLGLTVMPDLQPNPYEFPMDSLHTAPTLEIATDTGEKWVNGQLG
jgi:hypothetical protein